MKSFMAESYYNSIGRLRVAEKGLLTREQISRAAAASSHDEALRLVMETGYGAGCENPDDVEALIEHELIRVYGFIRELEVDPSVLDIFRLRADVLNLKLLLKLRMQGAELGDVRVLQHGGVYDAETLVQAASSGDYSALPKPIADVCEGLDVEMHQSPDPRRLSTALDSAYVAYAMTHGDRFAGRYFRAVADFDNIGILVRLRAMGATQSMYESCLLPEGYIPRRLLTKAYSMTDERIASDVIFDMVELREDALREREALRTAFNACVRGGGAAAIERARDNFLIALAAEHRNDIDSAAPIVGYMLAREQEARCVRLILTAKRNSLPQSVIEERMRELYG